MTSYPTYTFKKTLLLVFFLLTAVAPSHAVLKEKDLENTLSILREDITTYYNMLINEAEGHKTYRDQVIKELIDISNRSNQNALMLYSQKQEYVFDLTYACNEVTKLYKDYHNQIQPFRNSIHNIDTEIARYDSLKNSLNKMPTRNLSEKAQIDRNVCLTLAVCIDRMLRENRESMDGYIKIYDTTEERLQQLNDYANKRYNEIQNNIFLNGGENYLSILNHFGSRLNKTKETVIEKYEPYENVSSQWDSRMILGIFITMTFFGLASLLVSFTGTRLLSRKYQSKGFLYKRSIIMSAAAIIIFAIALQLIRVTWKQNFFIMASGLLTQYAWLQGVILISLLLRVESEQIRSALRIYLPLMAICFVIIAFRVILIPNELVNLILPPTLLICAIWQWWVIKRHNANIPQSDMIYTSISMLVFIVSVICSWMGYTLLSVQLLIWWIMQLTCILTITCLRSWVRQFCKKREEKLKKEELERRTAEAQKLLDDHVSDYPNPNAEQLHIREQLRQDLTMIKQADLELPVTKMWMGDLLYNVILPSLGVSSILLAVYWAASVFNLSELTWKYFSYKFIETPNITISVLNITEVIVLWLVFSFLNRTLKALLKHYFRIKDPSTAESRFVMGKNIIQLLVWGIWLLIVLGICHVNNTWLVVVSGGLSTGIGFASKDILENIYYGISLMAGRIKVGDWIICDGIRGRVSSINYTSTMVESVDGSIIAFQNSQLFTKNYKNMTKNHGREMHTLDVGVAYGTDIRKARKLLISAISKLPFIKNDPEEGHKVLVLLREFGESSVNLKVVVWVPVKTQYSDDCQILECVYNTLNDNGIEIPFPQRDLHIVSNTSGTLVD